MPGERNGMDATAIVTLAATAIGVVAGCVQVADYLEKKRAARSRSADHEPTGASSAPSPPQPSLARQPNSSPLPSGTVAFLFTDIQDSVSLWQSHPDAMRRCVTRYETLLREHVQAHGGHLYQTVGDACHAVFASARDALETAAAARRALHAQRWDDVGTLPVRMALHVGDAYEHGGDYFGASLTRVARLRDAAHGGQTLVSEALHTLAGNDLPDGVHLLDWGRHLLSDLQRPEPVFELRVDGLPQEFPPPRTLSSLPTNLPQQLTTFVGRDVQIAEVKRLLSSERLLTLTGAGGSGKTRLALQVAAETAEAYPDGVWLVELAAVSDPDLVPQAVSSLLGVREEPGMALQDVLAQHLKDCRTLLILDSCEHLLTACASLCERLLRACPHVSVLATSRESMGITGEQSFRVPSLALPELGAASSPERLEQCESVRLFVDRARQQGGNFVLSAGNAASVAQVCRGLDGIPFAIELAAARVRVLPVEQIATRLDDCFRLLTGGSRTALPRHQTLRALIDWSYDLLTEPEKMLICRLSVFSGGWDLEAAEAVGVSEGDDDWSVLDLLGALVEKSLVVYEPDGGGQLGRVRYRFLETVRRYAGERLAVRHETAALRARHRDYFLGLAERAAPALVGAEQGAWLAHLECEHDNLRAALDQCRDDPGGADPELHLAGALWRFWATRGYFTEGRERLGHALSRVAPGEDAARATAGFGAGLLAWQQCDYVAARSLLEESLALSRELNDDPGVARTLNILSQIAFEEGDYSSAQSLLEESLELHRQTGNRRGEAVALMNLGNIASEQSRYADARALYDQSLLLHRKMGDRGETATALLNLGSAALEQGNLAAAEKTLSEAAELFSDLGDKRGIAYAELCRGDVLLRQERLSPAQVCLRESLALCRDSGDRRGAAYALNLFGRLALARKQLLSAVHLLGAADALRTEIHAPPSASEKAQTDTALAALRATLGEAEFGSGWMFGLAMPLEAAVACAEDLPAQ